MVSGYIEAGQVAAALMTKSGNIYTGICIDTACSLGMCAERNAIAHMLTCGESEIRKLAVVMSDGTMSLPCGACCEFMMQLGQWAGEIEILIDYQKAEVRQLKDLCFYHKAKYKAVYGNRELSHLPHTHRTQVWQRALSFRISRKEKSHFPK